MNLRTFGLLATVSAAALAAYVHANGIRIHHYHAVPAPGKPLIVGCDGLL
jgi:hypothetical protein